ncbi:hypothetical protein I3760_05G251400 [Carya illinoinensis]|nr:hypothetical protein I3760_05G251400 [Carya illinoinensis]
MAKSYFFLFVVFILHHVRCQHDDCADSFRCGGHGPPSDFLSNSKTTTRTNVVFLGFICPAPIHTIKCSSCQFQSSFLSKRLTTNLKNFTYIILIVAFPRGIRRLNISSSPFQFTGVDQYFYDLAFFNCSHSTKGEKHSDWRAVSCHNHPTYSHQVYALRTDKDISLLPTLPCRKMYSVRSIPSPIVYNPDEILYLNWSRPACRNGELKAGIVGR